MAIVFIVGITFIIYWIWDWKRTMETTQAIRHLIMKWIAVHHLGYSIHFSKQTGQFVVLNLSVNHSKMLETEETFSSADDAVACFMGKFPGGVK